MRVMLLGLAVLVLAGCPQKREEMLRDETTRRYEAVVRWNQFDALVDFMHPDWLEEHPVRPLDIERLHQFKVSEYRVRQVISLPEGDGFDRIVRLHLYHLHSARERVVEYVEAWRWDDERKRWMLHSGLPDPTLR